MSAGKDDLTREIDKRIVDYRKQMNDVNNNPAHRYMASGAFEALRDLRTILDALQPVPTVADNKGVGRKGG